MKSDRWQCQAEFYRDLIETYGWRQERMLELVRAFAQHPIVRELHPSNSHEALGLSRYPTYKERCHHPMVYLVYDSHRDKFEAHWQRGQGKTVRKTVMEEPLEQEVIAEILAWLDNNRRTQPAHATDG